MRQDSRIGQTIGPTLSFRFDIKILELVKQRKVGSYIKFSRMDQKTQSLVLHYEARF